MREIGNYVRRSSSGRRLIRSLLEDLLGEPTALDHRHLYPSRHFDLASRRHKRSIGD